MRFELTQSSPHQEHTFETTILNQMRHFKSSQLVARSVSWIMFQCMLISVLDAGFKSYLFLTLFLTHLPLSLSPSTLPSSALPYSTSMLSWSSFKVNSTIFVCFRGSSRVAIQGVRLVVQLALATVISAYFLIPLRSLILVL